MKFFPALASCHSYYINAVDRWWFITKVNFFKSSEVIVESALRLYKLYAETQNKFRSKFIY